MKIKKSKEEIIEFLTTQVQKCEEELPELENHVCELSWGTFSQERFIEFKFCQFKIARYESLLRWIVEEPENTFIPYCTNLFDQFVGACVYQCSRNNVKVETQLKAMFLPLLVNFMFFAFEFDEKDSLRNLLVTIH